MHRADLIAGNGRDALSVTDDRFRVSRRGEDPHQPNADEEHDRKESDHDSNREWVIVSAASVPMGLLLLQGSILEWHAARFRYHCKLPRLSS
jgi:hypothetical protein